jgi:hypothetical protein
MPFLIPTVSNEIYTSFIHIGQSQRAATRVGRGGVPGSEPQRPLIMAEAIIWDLDIVRVDSDVSCLPYFQG